MSDTAQPIQFSYDRPHSVLVSHVRLRDTHGWIGTRPGCLACVEQFGSDYAPTLEDVDERPGRQQ